MKIKTDKTRHQVRNTIPRETMKIISACRNNAKQLIESSKLIFRETKSYNIAYHLATLALEEVGKITLTIIIKQGSKDVSERQKKWLEDHEKKLFWALWKPVMFGKDLIGGASIRKIQGLAKRIHDRRLKSLYVDCDVCNGSTQEKIKKAEVKNLISITEARIGYENCHLYISLSTKEQTVIDWFLNATDDPEKRKLIFGGASIKKLIEFNDSKKWMSWLYSEFDKADKEASAALKKELKREKPSTEEASKPKWEISFRIYTNSHSVRTNKLKWWNDIIHWIQLYPVNNCKNQIIAKMTLPMNMPIHALW